MDAGADGSETDIAAAVEKVLRERPNLILTVLDNNPVVFSELVERAAEIRKAKAEEDRWRAELKRPKVIFCPPLQMGVVVEDPGAATTYVNLFMWVSSAKSSHGTCDCDLVTERTRQL